MTVWTFVALVIGLIALVLGAELLVKGAASVATRLGIPPVIVGLTVVAFGTSAPEFAVSIGAATSGKADVAFGNVVGSNIGNILLILGASAIVGALTVSQRIVRLDIPLLIGVSIVVMAISLDNEIGRVDGAVLFAGIIGYTLWVVRAARSERSGVVEEYQDSIDELEGSTVERPLAAQIAFIVAGLVVLVAGSQLLVTSATDVAGALGISDLVIGLTVVAIGTSLPELATSLLAALRGQRDIAVGNVVGSNLFNLLGVLGASALLAPDGIAVSDASIRLDLVVMLAATLVLLPIVWSGFRIERWEGTVLVAFYVAFVTYLVLDANDHDATSVLGPAMLFAIPLAGLGFGVAGWQGWRRHRNSSQV